jgi:DNA-binding transcriptional LysR family regulator
VRSTRHHSLTPAGQLLFARSQSMASLIDGAQQEIVQLRQRPRGPLRITVPTALASSVLVPALAQLTQQFPDLQPRVVVDDAIVPTVQQRIDLALRVGSLPDSGLRAIRVGELRGLVVASPAYLAAAAAIESLDDLSAHAWIAAPWQSAQKQLLLQGPQGVQRRLPWTQRYQINSAAIACELAVQGQGLALLPDLLVGPALQRGLLRVVLADWQEPAEAISLLHAYPRQVPLAVRKLQGLIATQVQHLTVQVHGPSPTGTQPD